MKLYTNCKYCKEEIRFRAWVADRIEFKMSKGDFVSLNCKSCNRTEKYKIDDVKAEKNRILQLTAFIILLIGTPVLLFVLWDYLFSINNIYGILGLASMIAVPSSVYLIIIRNDLRRIIVFNNS